MGGVETSAHKNEGSVDGCPKKWGGYTCPADGRALLSTPPEGVFGTFPYKIKLFFHSDGNNRTFCYLIFMNTLLIQYPHEVMFRIILHYTDFISV